MSKAPAMPMYWYTYLADTTHLTTEEHGAYLLLLGAMWRRNGSVPDHDADNARIVGLTKAKWRKAKARLEPFLTVHDGRIVAPAISQWIQWQRKAQSRQAIPLITQKEVRDRDGDLCAYCGDTEGPFHLDHIIPWSRGGDHSLGNLTISCATCNLSKGDKTPEEWRREQ